MKRHNLAMVISLPKCLAAAFLCALAVVANADVRVASGPVRQPDPLLWGGLKPGRFAVGYRSTFQFDYARQYDVDYPLDPSLPHASKPRPILIDAWYPARPSSAKSLKYREYLDVASSDPRVTPMAKRLAYNIREVVCEETVGKVPTKASPAERAAFHRLLETRTFAVKNAVPALGRFPVVIYHPGVNGTPEDSSALFEYLASHGYIVLSSAYQGPDAYSVHCGEGDIPCSFRDMEFLCRYARGLPFANADQLGAMGHSLGAWMTFAWVAEPDSSVRALVSLDSGLEYDTVETSGVDSLKYQMKVNERNIRAASLRFASRERDANFEDIDLYLKYGPQYRATVEGLKHNDFLTHGAIGPALLPAKWPDAQKKRRQSYDAICKHVLYFLDATLSHRPEAKKALEQSIRAKDPETGFTLQYKPPTPARPTPRQLSQYILNHGIEQAFSLMRQFGGGADSLVPAAHVLVQDGEAKRAVAVLRKIDQAKPNQAQVQALLGQALQSIGDRDGALAAFRKGQEIITTDKSVGQIWKYYIEEGLKELGPSEPKEKGH